MSKFAVFGLLTVASVLSLFAGSVLLNNDANAVADGANRTRAINAAVVDIEEITNDFLRSNGALEGLSEKYSTKRQALQTLERTIRNMEQDSAVYPKNDPRYIDLKTQI